MRRVFMLLLLFVSGCSGGIYTPIVEMQADVSLPMLATGAGNDMPVVYPSGAKGGASNDPMVQAFGTSWRNVENDYPEYTFNP